MYITYTFAILLLHYKYIFMLQKFVDRARELEFLERHFKREEAGFIVLYGRRRVGKTELLNRFIKHKKHIYFLARRESEAETFNRLSNELYKLFHDETLISGPISSLDSFFEYLYERTKEEKIAVVIDEFPFLIEKFRGLPSVLQDHWDNKLRFSRIFLILCGSSIGMVETEVLGYRSPLYGSGMYIHSRIISKEVRQQLLLTI